MLARIFCGAVSLLLFCLVALVHSASDNAVSTLYIADLQTTFSINLPSNSSDVNFYFSAPSWYGWFGIGFGSAMADTLMLVFYASANGADVTVSPRLGTGDTEPAYYPNATITLLDGSSINNSTYEASGTCYGCRNWPTGFLDVNSTVAQLIFAIGPSLPAIASDSLSVGIKRHMGYGTFTMNLQQATGAGSVPFMPAASSDGAVLTGTIHEDSDKADTAHALLMAVATFAMAPADAIAASLLRRWPLLHIITSIVYLAFVIAGMVFGLIVSKEYILTQNYTTSHQLLGFMAIAIMLLVGIVGGIHGVFAAAARRRGQELPKKSSPLGRVHMWSGRLVWVLLVIDGGLGLELEQAQVTWAIGWAALAIGVVLVLLPIYLCVWCVLRRKEEEKEDENSAMQLAQLYAPH